MYRLKHRKPVLCKTLEEFLNGCDIKRRRVRLTRVGQYAVSSVFDPYLGRFETAVFFPSGTIKIIDRTLTHRALLHRHWKIVAKVKAGEIA